ncbi:hypothetical protein RJT34_02209 [Clitoria ternatea]|uniref:Uncharacterized protein n=1 Tax=Clitoria ternatea TaxID=43366 RepID=A0AAN9KKA3_CLITE
MGHHHIHLSKRVIRVPKPLCKDEMMGWGLGLLSSSSYNSTTHATPHNLESPQNFSTHSSTEQLPRPPPSVLHHLWESLSSIVSRNYSAIPNDHVTLWTFRGFRLLNWIDCRGISKYLFPTFVWVEVLTPYLVFVGPPSFP